MKNILIALVSLGFSLQSLADACGAKSVVYDREKIELAQIMVRPETTAEGKAISGSEEVLVSGIYMFVRNGTNWNIYRCANDNADNPKFNSSKCVLKNDFQSGQLVKLYGNSGITVRITDQKTLQIRLNAVSAGDLNYYDIKASEKGLEVVENQFKEDKEQPSRSFHKPVSLGVCKPQETVQAAAKKTGIPSKKVGISN